MLRIIYFTFCIFRLGWLLNYNAISMPDESGCEKSALDLYYIDREGGNFKATVFFKPYFYLDINDSRRITEITGYLLKKFDNCQVIQIDLEDLDLPNHLSGKKHKFLKISFNTVQDLTEAKNELKNIITENMKKKNDNNYEEDDYDVIDNSANFKNNLLKATDNPLSFVTDMREFDVVRTFFRKRFCDA